MTTRTAVPHVAGPPHAIASGLTPVRTRRRPWLVLLAGLVSALGVLTVMWLVGVAGQRQDVLALARQVPYGQVIDRSDLVVTRVSLDPGVAAMPASAVADVLGKVAATTLLPGMLMSPDLVTAAGEPTAGRVLVPLAVPADRMPTGGLRPGDRILVVDTESPGSPTPASVVRVGAMDVNGVTVVDVTTAPAAGPAVTVASAEDHIALVVEPAGR